MTIWSADTLCWHLRLESGRASRWRTSSTRPASSAASASASTLHHVRTAATTSCASCRPGRRPACGCGGRATSSGRAHRGDTVAEGVAACGAGSSGSGDRRADAAARVGLLPRRARWAARADRARARTGGGALGDGRRGLRRRRPAAAREPLGLHGRRVRAGDGRGRARAHRRVPRPHERRGLARGSRRRRRCASPRTPTRRTSRTTSSSRCNSPTATTVGGSPCTTAIRARGSHRSTGSSRALVAAADGSELCLTVEGLDNRVDIDDQRARLAPSLALLRSLVAA